MNWNYCLVIILVLAIFPTFKNINAALRKTDGKTGIELLAQMNLPTKGEIFINDKLISSDGKQYLTVEEIQKEATFTADDGSQISTTYDAYGNKTEIRKFFNHPRLKQMIMRTSVEGQKQIYVYGQNGEVESLPENMLDRAMNIPSDEIASVAGITNVKREKIKPAFTQITQLPTIQVNPLQNNQLPAQNQTTETIKEETQTTENVEETPTVADKNLALKQTKETETKKSTAKP